ncbi:24143_t:CDS:2, partial [Gigaspora rosea]
AKFQKFCIIKDCVQHDNSVVQWRTYLYELSHVYKSNSMKDTNTKETQCPFLVNTSCPKINDSENSIIINKIIENHNYLLNPKRIKFEDMKKFSDTMLEDPIYSNDLYTAIQKFCPNSKTLSNDAAQIISNWLDQKKNTDSYWVV